MILIEAKNYISNDFLVRQLYYPYTLWSNKIHKKVRPVFLTYTNGIFHLREYEFTEAGDYNSVNLVKHKKYAVKDGDFNMQVLSEILDRTEIKEEPQEPFPQANSFERIINLCELLKQKGFISKEEITQNYDFTARQTNYYSSAGKYLGMVKSARDPSTGQFGYFLTDRGENVFGQSIADRRKEFVKIIVSHAVFRETLNMFLKYSEIPTNETVVGIMKRCGLHKVDSEKTYYRRASTIKAWINWIVGQIEA